MGAVYRAIQRSLERTVAIKVLPTALLAEHEGNFTARFEQEALTMARLRHPGIVGVFETGEVEGLRYIVMEYVDGTDVSRMLHATGRLPPETALRLVQQTCEALHHVHELGIIHRDIKPANLLVTRDGLIKIADFGLARHADVAVLQLTRTNVAVGTSDFVPPELWLPGVELDRRADIYALGVTLYQMLVGEVPRGLWEAASIKAGTDPRLDAVIDRAMEPDRDARYPTAEAFRRDLERIHTSDLPLEAVEGLQPPASTAVTPPPARPHPRRLASAALAVLALAIVFGVWRQFESTSPATALSFNGTNDHVRVAASPIPTNGPFTIECWVKADPSPVPRYTTLISQAMDESFPRFYIGTGLRGEVRVGDAWIDTGFQLPTGEWHHLALVRTEVDAQLLLDGVEVARRDSPISNPSAAPWLDIGKQFGTLPEHWDGSVDELRIWSTARTPEQLRSNMRSRITPKTPELAAYYRFDEGSGSRVRNLALSTGSSFDGTVLGMPVWQPSTRPVSRALW